MKNAGILWKFTSILLVVGLVGCAANPQKDSTTDAPLIPEKDPWEGFNRKVFAFNDTLDRFFLKPVARGYRFVTPDFMETGVTNFFSNVGEVPNALNNVLQWKWGKAANSTGRLLINTTVGVGGLFDVARHAGLPKLDGESFGQTLSYWGVDQGPYVILPFLGPATMTDTVAMPADWFMDPVSYVENKEVLYGLKALDVVQIRAGLLEAEKLISGDRYIFIREAYLQRREYLVQDGKVEDDFGGDLEEFDDDF
ncbi:MAG: VacJ family lipoprotein [Cellvibrionaceae bacterium]|nr:VacJ family lipoprotein [Cellvibrionaceae bacterium]